MVEKDMQTLFTRHIRVYPPKETEAYELKICKGTSLPFNSLQEHQVKALLEAEEGSLFHKITDQPWIADRPYTFTAKKPFDCFCLVKVRSYVIVWFYAPKKPKVFIKIAIKDFIKESLNSSRKSLTEKRAEEIGMPFFVNIK